MSTDIAHAVPPPMEVPQASQTEVYRTIGEIELRMFIFNPSGHKSGDSRPAIVFFFGGGWVDGHARQFAPQCAYLASRGMVAMTAEYRVKNRHGTAPAACVQDANAAVRWVRTHAQRLGVDPQRVAAGGGSAGGHIAACIGVINGLDEPDQDATVSAKPDALLLFNPALVFDAGPGEEPLPADYQARMAERLSKEERAALSPYRNLSKDDPPTIIFHGEADTTVPIDTVRRYVLKATKLDLRCELAAYPDQVHGFFNHHSNVDAFRRTMKAADEFLVSLGYLTGSPTIDQFEWNATPNSTTPDQKEQR
ncbi:MAG: alpha/beta hydrolase [Phycisphaeraceae bacterium]